MEIVDLRQMTFLGRLRAVSRWFPAVAMPSLLLASHLLALSPAAEPWKGYARFERLSLDDGLSQSVVNAIVQDRQGLLWFATQDGLNRYDGYSFRIFKTDPDDSGSISDNLVYCLLVDRAGTLWAGTDNGLNRFDRDREEFVRFRRDEGKTERSGVNRVRCLCEDRSGALWLGTQGAGLSCLDPKSGRFQDFTPDPNDTRTLSGNDVRTILEGHDGSLWVGTTGGLNRLDRSTGIFQRFPHLTSEGGSPGHNSVWCLLEFAPGTIWVGTQGGLFVLDCRTGLFKRFADKLPARDSLGFVPVQSMTRSGAGEMWVCTKEGVYRLSTDGGVRVRYSHDPTDARSLSVDDIQAVCEDDSGILWFGTYSGSVNKLDVRKEKFANFTAGRGGRQVLSNPSVWAFCEDETGSIWVGTEGGLDRLAPGGGSVTHYLHDPATPGSLIDNRVQRILLDRAGRLWIGTSGGLDRRDPAKDRFVHYRKDPRRPSSLSSNDVMSLLEDRSGSLWVGTFDAGLNQMDPASGECRRFAHVPEDPTSLADNYVTCLYEDRSGVLWVGTNNGLNRYDRAASAFRLYTNATNNTASLSHNRIRSIHEDRAGRLWIGTRGGLNLMDRERGTFTRFTMDDGLPNDVIYGILEDDSGCLWISTNRGLSRFNPKTKLFRNFEAADGLQSNEFNQGGFLRLRSGEMLFGGIGGFTRFRPDDIPANPHVPPLILTDFRKFGKSVRLDRSLSAIDEMTLSYRENTIAFEFAALDFTNPGKNRYSYRLEGFDNDWIDNGTSRVATYTNLDGGQYLFRVRGANSDGVWNRTGLTMRLTIVPPFWRTTWFRVLAVLLLAVVLNIAYFAGRRVVTALIYWRKTTFVAHFRTLDVLGKGGMGTVYKAVNIVTKEIVALKVLNEELCDEAGRKRFIQEGLVCEKIRHPSIVQVYERGEHNSRFYYSMEYIEGVPLRALMRGSSLGPASGMVVFSVMLDIVRDIHAAGIIHRDIKPENIMLKKGFDLASMSKVRNPQDLLRRNLKLLDFGIAKFVGTQSLTQTGVVSGTLRYIPPEMISGERNADGSFDFYSLGMMLREMLTGSSGYEEDEPATLMYAILNRRPRSARAENPNVPTDISELVDDLLERHVVLRLRDYETIRERTDRILEGLLRDAGGTAE